MTMAEWLTVRMPRAAGTAAAWLVTDEAGRPLAAVQTGPLESAAAAASGRRVAVLVHPAEVLSLEAELPERAGARAAQLVPFALEEQLADDIDAQHFAVAPAAAGGRTPVAVVSRALLEDWLAQLKAAGIAPDLLCSEAALLPRIAGQAIALLEGDTLLLAAEGDRPPVVLSAPPGGFGAALDIALGDRAAETSLQLYSNPVDWQRRSAEVEATRARLGALHTQLLGSGALPWLAAQLPQAAPINLLQGPYAPRTSLRASWGRWRMAAGLAAALLLLHAISQLYSLWHLGREARELDQQIAALAGPQYAGASESIRPRLEAELRDPGAAGGRSGLLPALQVLAQAMNGLPGARLRSLTFRDGALQLKVRANDAQSIDRINQSLRAAGWQAELTAGGAAGDAFEGNIALRGGAG
ncbi:MAG TPA: type II secretion system protein GspL [Steroidobacteraceae bacterium]|nr:type II secretion system protein GspL [Steroidobacteraceae bacterium]